MFHHMQEKLERNNVLVVSSNFIYDENPAASHLLHFTACGYRRVTEQSYISQCLPPYQYEYHKIRSLGSQALLIIDTSALCGLSRGFHKSS